MRGYQENETTNTADAFMREFNALLRENRFGWQPLESRFDSMAVRQLRDLKDTLGAFDAGLLARMRERGIRFCVCIYDVRLEHAQNVYEGEYGGLGYGAHINKSLFLRCAVISTVAGQPIRYTDIMTSMKGTQLGLTEAAVRRLFGWLMMGARD
jgi:hypothetical protein